MGAGRGIGSRVAVGAWIAVVAVTASADVAEVRVERGPREDVAHTRAGDCAIALEHRKPWATLTYRNHCAQTLAEKGQALAVLLDALFGEGKLPADVHSLALGRMIRFSEDLSLRMALDGHASPEWAAAMARHADRDVGSYGEANHWVTAWIDATDAYDPIAAPLRARGAIPKAGTVEKVLITPPAPAALGAVLVDRGVPPEAHVPFDAQVWLVFERPAIPED